MTGRFSTKGAKLAVAFILMAALASLTLLLAAPDHAFAASGSGDKVVWTQKGGKFYCKIDGKRQVGKIVTINKKKYLFDKNGAQQTGWRKVGKSYYYFKPGKKSAGYMVENKVVNGVRLLPTGKALLNSETRKEMVALREAQDFLDKYTKPAWSKSKKLSKSFRVLVKNYSERLWHQYSHSKGWARREALDLFQKKSGPCYAYGAAFAYIASAIGYKKCVAVSSGAHGWAEINGKVYDPEWTKHQSRWLYGISESQRGEPGILGYFSNGFYKVTINPQSKEIGGTKSAKSKWVTINGNKYYFKSNGKMATGSTKIKGKWYVFKSNGKLALGKTTHIVTVNGSKYQVSKSGRAKAGWNSKKTRYYNKKGQMLTGDSVVGEKFLAFSSSGVYNSARTAKLRSASVLEKDASKLIALLGTPKKTSYSKSCNQVKDEAGNWMEGDDGILEYANFCVYTFRGTDGIVRFMGVSSK